MKKKFSFILLTIIIFVSVGCGSKEEDMAYVIKKDGSNENLKILDICTKSENIDDYNKYYSGAEIYLTGTVKNIDYKTSSGVTTSYESINYFDTINFEEGFVLKVPVGAYKNVEIKNGAKLYIGSNIYSSISCPDNIILGGYLSDKITTIRNISNVKSSEVDKTKKVIMEEKKLYEILLKSKSSLDFISKYAGNINYKGSRKFDDGFMNEFMEYTDFKLDYNVLEEYYSGITMDISKIESENKQIYNLLNEMGRTNTSTNVSTIKIKANSNLEIINSMLDKII